MDAPCSGPGIARKKARSEIMPGIYDIFFSYRRHDLSRAQPLLGALASTGLRVFQDETAIDEGLSIVSVLLTAPAISRRNLLKWADDGTRRS